jgi:hypothetical protein
MLRFFSVLSLLFVACAPSVSVVPYASAGAPSEPRLPQTVEVFYARKPTQPYKEVAMFDANGTNENKVFQTLRAAAASHGCDGLIVQPRRIVVPSYGFFGGGGSFHNGFSAACIMFNAQRPS